MIALPLPLLLAVSLLAAPEPQPAPAAPGAPDGNIPAGNEVLNADAYRYADELFQRRDETGAPQTASKLLEKAIAASPLDTGLLWRYGRARVVLGERTGGWGRNAHFVDAEQSLQAALDIDGELVEARYWLAMARFRREHYKEALEALQPALAQAPQDARLHRLAGDILWRAPKRAGGDRRVAVREYESALENAGLVPESYLSLAEAYAELGRQKDAEGLLERLEKLPEPGPSRLAGADRQRLDKLRRRLGR